MSETRTLLVPQLALNYDGNVLGSVGIGGELYVRDTPLIAENAVIKAENAKMRELVRRLIDHIEHPPCDGCMFEMNCMGGEGLTQCDEFQLMHYDARELGIDVFA